MKYTLIGLLSWPAILGLAPHIGMAAAIAITCVSVPALWAIAWRLEFGDWRFWK
jgi:hypothetical protein